MIGLHIGDWGFGMVGMVSAILANLLFIALIAVVVVLIVRALNRPGPSTPPASGTATAEQILAERYARGEIGEEEYHARLRTLRGAPPAA